MTTSRRSAPSKLSTMRCRSPATGGAGGKPPPGCWPFTSTPVPLKMRALSSAVGSPGCSARSAASASAGDIDCVPFIGVVRMATRRAALRSRSAATRRPREASGSAQTSAPRKKGGMVIVVIRLSRGSCIGSAPRPIMRGTCGAFEARCRRGTCSAHRGIGRIAFAAAVARSRSAVGRARAGPRGRRAPCTGGGAGIGLPSGVDVCAWTAACAAARHGAARRGRRPRCRPSAAGAAPSAATGGTAPGTGAGTGAADLRGHGRLRRRTRIGGRPAARAPRIRRRA